MIICKNCGAEYDDEQDRCPYCGGRKCRKKWLAKECRGQQSLG